jgi:hypothetical protein
MTGAPACPMSDHQKGAVAAFLALYDRLQASFAAATSIRSTSIRSVSMR